MENISEDYKLTIMKELSIEEKAKAYDELKVKAQELTEDGYIDKLALLDLFPELKESEDERIRKWCISHFNECINVIKDNDEYKEYLSNKVIAWLKKQGKKKSIWHNEDEEPQRGSLILLIMQSGNPIVAKIIEPNHTFNHGERWAYINDLLEKQGKNERGRNDTIYEIKNHAWSEEDEYLLCETTQHLEELIRIDKTNHCGVDVQYYQRDIDWLKSLKDRVQPQPKWSEKDEYYINDLIKYFLQNEKLENTKEDIVIWLKSLKPQNTWKPSDEQMAALSDINCTGYISYAGQGQELINLYNGLKKLKS